MLVSGSNYLGSLSAAALARIDRVTSAQPTGASSDPLGAAPAKSARDEFMDYAQMTPAQKMRSAMLGKLGVTEEDLKAMSPEERKKIEDRLKEMIKQQVENDPKMKTGSILDVSA